MTEPREIEADIAEFEANRFHSLSPEVLVRRLIAALREAQADQHWQKVADEVGRNLLDAEANITALQAKLADNLNRLVNNLRVARIAARKVGG